MRWLDFDHEATNQWLWPLIATGEETTTEETALAASDVAVHGPSELGAVTSAARPVAVVAVRALPRVPTVTETGPLPRPPSVVVADTLVTEITCAPDVTSAIRSPLVDLAPMSNWLPSPAHAGA
jgi:hypothetical protein